jgi:hypothetical protein
MWKIRKSALLPGYNIEKERHVSPGRQQIQKHSPLSTNQNAAFSLADWMEISV